MGSIDALESSFVVDADVLIDYLQADERILLLFVRHLGPVTVLVPVMEEVNEFDAARADRLGLHTVHPELDLLLRAADGPQSLSFADNCCLLHSEENSCTCITNDRALRRECGQRGVSTLWGLQAMGELVRCGGLSKDRALAIAQELHQNNPGHIHQGLLERFKESLSS